MNRFARTGETADPCGVPFPAFQGSRPGVQRHSQPPLDIQQHPAAIGDRLHRFDDQVPRYLVEELLDIKIDRPVVLPAPCRHAPSASWADTSGGSHRSPGGTWAPRSAPDTWPPPSARPCQRSSARRAHGPAAMRLGDHDRPDRRRKPGPRAHPVPDLVEVVLKVGLELVELLPVHARGALVGLDLPVRLPHQLLGNRKRLAVRLWHILLASSRGLAPVDRIGHPW